MMTIKIIVHCLASSQEKNLRQEGGYLLSKRAKMQFKAIKNVSHARLDYSYLFIIEIRKRNERRLHSISVSSEIFHIFFGKLW